MLPPKVARYLDGTDLLAKTQALRLSTVDAAGWPHAALLSAGDMLAVTSERIRFVIFPQSATTWLFLCGTNPRFGEPHPNWYSISELLGKAPTEDHGSVDPKLRVFGVIK
jgi:hypothetical protein